MRHPASRDGLLAVLLLAAAWLPAAAGAPSAPVTHQAVPGGVAVVPIRPTIAGEEPPEVRFGRHRVIVMEVGGAWQAVVGLPLALVPGQYIVTITPAGRPVWSQTFEVRPKRYPLVRAAPGEGGLVDAALPVPDKEPVRAALSGWREGLGNALPLEWPVKGPVVMPFGLQRVRADGELVTARSLAIRPASPGSTVDAPAGGIVSAVLRSDGGEAVLVDHGHGVLSLLYPLQRVQVQQEERLVPGHPLGYPAPAADAGSDAATTSVVHWAVSINAAWVDPTLVVGP